MTTTELFALIQSRLEILQSVSKDGKPRTEALEALAEIERRVKDLEFPPKTILPEWCLTTSSNQLRSMAAQEYPICEVPLLGIDGVYWDDLIKMAEQREAVDLVAAQRNEYE